MEQEKEHKQQKPKGKWFKGWLTGGGLALVLIVLFMVIFPRMIKRTIERKVLAGINAVMVHPIEFSDASLTFFRHFPDMTMSFNDLKIKGSNQTSEAYFAEVSSFTLKVNWLAALIAKDVEVDGIIIDRPVVNLLVDEKGIPNYNIIKTRKDTPKDTTSILEKLESGDVSIEIELLAIEKAEVYVVDEFRDFDLHLGGVHYRGKGENAGKELIIRSETTLEEVDLLSKGFAYFNDNQLKSEHLTIFKEDEVTLLLQRNEGFFNELRFSFEGQIDFLANGLGINFHLDTDTGDLKALFSSLPGAVAKWHEEKGVDLQGEAAITLDINGQSIQEENLQPDLEFNLKWANGQMVPDKAKAPIEDIQLDLTVTLPSMDLQKVQVAMDTINFKSGDYYLKGHVMLQKKDAAQIYVKGDIDTQLDLADLTEALALDSISMKGQLLSKMHVEGVYDTINGKYPFMDGRMRIVNGKLKTHHYPKPIEDIQLAMDFHHDGADPKSAVLDIPKAGFTFEDEEFTMTAKFNDLTNLKFDLSCAGILHLGRLYRVFGRDNIELGGIASLDMTMRGSQKIIEDRDFDRFYSSGSMILEGIQLVSPFLEQPVNLENGTFSFDKGMLRFDHFKGSYARTNFIMNGELRQYVRHFFYEDERIHGRFAFEADQVYLEDLLVQSEEELSGSKGQQGVVREANRGDSLQVGVLQIPDYVDVTLDFKTNDLYWDKLHITNLNGLLAVVEGGLFAKDVNLNMIDASIRMDGVYKNFKSERAFFEYDLHIKEFDVQRAYNEVALFREMAPGAGSAEGQVGLNYRLSGVLNKEMNIIYPSLEGGGVLTLTDVRVKNHEILSEISEKTGNKEMKDAELQEIEIHSRISNNVIDVERFKFRVRPFRLRFEGQTSLDKQVNLRMRLGLPPLGIIGIPIKITGTKPDIKLRLGKKTKKLDETFYDEDGIKDIRLAKYTAFKDSLTADMSIGKIQRVKNRIKSTPVEAFRPPGRKVPRTISKDLP